MRHLLLAAALFLPAGALAQTAQAPKLPPANPLPYEDPDAAAVLAPINALFVAFEAGDGAAVLRQVYPDGRVTMAEDGKAPRLLNWSQFAGSLKPGDGFKERITGPAIEIDGDIAMVWAPFTVWVGGKLNNCGYDHFDLIRENGTWKVMNLTFSSRTIGCAAQ
ncbi:nuclear transport factor 2 family protein [Sphingomonas sp. AOB5]|uniref:nuclear transport factor 2 family protein n=1 Tax=Sphingomonas sp. AOB5 TaxID=3034017 RepID=UPI0023F787E7|nr:nuclear transport factor 2 family protein [Sphingomonas sp. AOB5]MDF7776820.1 nuclear transport factor 2 family protein [Sphingomonas sp. AOB5]